MILYQLSKYFRQADKPSIYRTSLIERGLLTLTDEKDWRLEEEEDDEDDEVEAESINWDEYCPPPEEDEEGGRRYWDRRLAESQALFDGLRTAFDWMIKAEDVPELAVERIGLRGAIGSLCLSIVRLGFHCFTSVLSLSRFLP